MTSRPWREPAPFSPSLPLCVAGEGGMVAEARQGVGARPDETPVA